MQSHLWIRGLVLVVSASLSVQIVVAGPQEDVAAAGEKWATVFADNNPETMVAFYAKDGVLWGTLSPTVRSDPAAVKAYFVGAFEALPKATVKFGDQLIRVYGNTAVNTGYYTFFYVKDGETKSIPARYSFTYVKDGDEWKIVDHHSSAVPPPPR
ncbi:MAG TPA: SgcJ/EcaC family oxidoreductase [Xanthobacteraceae bacterium]|nr:SgcJ/EcaC family oxidoreductase [Xanthobacteraceae bacterium]